MTASLSKSGQIVLPKKIWANRKFRPGTRFAVVSRLNGEIVLRPIETKEASAERRSRISKVVDWNAHFDRPPSNRKFRHDAVDEIRRASR